MSLNRRQFVQHTVATVLASSSLGAVAEVCLAAQEKQPVLPIVDTHQHLWDLTKFQPPWLKGAPAILSKSYVTADYVAATEGLNVVKAVYMEVDVAVEQQVEEAQHLIELCKSPEHPTVAAVISGRPNSDGFKAYIARFKDSPYIKGVRQVLHAPDAKQGLCLEKTFVASVRLLGELGMSFDLCMRPAELADGVKLADLCPDTRLIVDHCGNADPKAFRKSNQTDSSTTADEPSHNADHWRRDIAELAKRRNVICKISGIVARAPQGWTAADLAPIINHCLDHFGPDRVIFGSDWPVCLLGASLRQWVTALKDVISHRSEADQRKLLHDNAVRLYRLR